LKSRNQKRQKNLTQSRKGAKKRERAGLSEEILLQNKVPNVAAQILLITAKWLGTSHHGNKINAKAAWGRSLTSHFSLFTFH